MKRQITFPLITLIFSLFLNTAFAGDQNRQKNGTKELAWELAPAKTYEDLQVIAEKPSPLDALSPDAKKRFIESIVFTESGVGGFDYRDLEMELTATEIYRILSLIGQQHFTVALKKAKVESKSDEIIMFGGTPETPEGDFLLDFYCYQRGSCEKSENKACTKNC